MDAKAERLIDEAAAAGGLIVLLTGAGVSAESGIPTFRGEEGYWTAGSKVYHPQQMATLSAFRTMPDVVWQWYLYRRGICRQADPNPAHHALAQLESALGDRFRLVTQNVDGLHLRAGNSPEQTFQIHGNIDFSRCSAVCTYELDPLPEDVLLADRDAVLSPDTLDRLVCPRCSSRARPHVLWFDEYYDEELFRAESAVDAAQQASLVVTIGTSGSTTLPYTVVRAATDAGAAFVDINPEANPFSQAAASLTAGAWIRSTACESVPRLCERLSAAA